MPADTIPARLRSRRIVPIQRPIGRTGFRLRYHPVPGAIRPSRPALRKALPKALLGALGARISEHPSPWYRVQRVNDVRTINLNDALMNLNSPLFLPCSRPKQRSGHSGRLGRSGIQVHDPTADAGFAERTVCSGTLPESKMARKGSSW